MHTDDFTTLVVLDDQSLHSHVTRYLETAGSNVVLTSRINQAKALQTDFDLLIIDEQILSDEGAGFILDEHHVSKETDVIFIGESWCDELIYRWLREILRVSTVLFKPLDDRFFFISLLRSDLRRHLRRSDSNGFNRAKEIGTAPDTTAVEGGPDDVIQATQLRLRAAVAEEWAALTSSFEKLLLKEFDRDEVNLVATRAHKLRGSAGSLGLKKVSQCAADVEDWLRLFYPREGFGQKILLESIEKRLAEGQSAMSKVEPPKPLRRDEPAHLGLPLGAPLVTLTVCEDEDQQSELQRLLEQYNVEIVALNEPIKIFSEIEWLNPELIVLHSKIAGLSIYNICTLLRTNAKSKDIPIICFHSDESFSFDAADLPQGVFSIPEPSDGIAQREFAYYLQGIIRKN